ncbi:MAG TPA: tRNA (guanosine(37)-N1)-methyltransferase TrmD [Firmicutes bacterium]|nr:tRNA (guanosine(37)-N1)-methyltransferase TrmD [Candidatus Fermentithermobacillaceae bacterium]
MKVYVLTLFPEMFRSVLGSSILKRAQDEGFLEVVLVNIRDFAHDAHRTVDDYPYGGGPGMVMKPEPVYEAVEWVAQDLGRKPYVVLMTPQGMRFNAKMAESLARADGLTLVAGHYEGFDERIRFLADMEISIGDFVLTGGEIPAMAVLDAVSRFIPGVLGHTDSAGNDSFSDGLLEGPQYTRPPEYRGMKVPDVLQSGDYGRIRRWQRKEALRRTYLRRPDLLADACLTFEDRCFLQEILSEEGPAREEEG